MKPKKSHFLNSLLTFTFCVAGHAVAADYNWNAATGDFNTGTNWLIGTGPGTGVPGNLDNAIIANGGTAQWTTAAAKTVLELRTGYGAAGSAAISGGNTFTASNGISIGTQNGATLSALTVSGTGTVVSPSAGNTLVGSSSAAVGTAGSGATGILNITAGATYTHLPTGNDSFRIGDNTAAQAGTHSGILNVDGGTLNLPGARLYVGQSAGSSGEVAVSNNGTVNVTNNWIVIGRGGLGKLTLTGSSINKAGANNVAIGDNAGTGTADHTGGTLAVNAGELFVGNGAGGTGTTISAATASSTSPTGWSSAATAATAPST